MAGSGDVNGGVRLAAAPDGPRFPGAVGGGVPSGRGSDDGAGPISVPLRPGSGCLSAGACTESIEELAGIPRTRGPGSTVSVFYSSVFFLGSTRPEKKV